MASNWTRLLWSSRIKDTVGQDNARIAAIVSKVCLENLTPSPMSPAVIPALARSNDPEMSFVKERIFQKFSVSSGLRLLLRISF